MKVAGEVRNLRRFPHAEGAVAYLRELGATEISVTQNNHLRIHWRTGAHRMNISLSCTPAVVEACARTAKQLIRRRYREIGLEIAA